MRGSLLQCGYVSFRSDSDPNLASADEPHPTSENPGWEGVPKETLDDPALLPPLVETVAALREAVQNTLGFGDRPLLRVLFSRAVDLVQKLQIARRELTLEASINRLDRFNLLILDHLPYVSNDQAARACCSSSSALTTKGDRR
jgi:hypothetical protein